MNAMRILVVYNPSAGGGRARELLPAIRQYLEEKNIAAEFLLTEARGHASVLVEQHELTPFDAVVAAGGDGTLFEVLNGYLRNAGVNKPALGLIPNGTGNAFMKELGLRTSDWRKAIDIIALNQPRAIDVGRLQSQGQTWHFLNIVGMGFIAEIAERAARLKWMGNAAYTVAVLLQLPRLKAQRLSLVIDGERVEHEGIFVEVANSSYTGTSFLIAPRARLDDGLLDVVLLKRVSRLGLLRLLRTVYDGSHIRHPQVEYLQARSITVTEAAPGRLVPDGEILGSTPADFECVQGAVRFLWP
jgi:diacylglycerol kinase (ATP)